MPNFIVNGKTYSVSTDVYTKKLDILLPTGELMIVDEWREVYPEQIAKASIIQADIPVSQDVADILNAEIAKEI